MQGKIFPSQNGQVTYYIANGNGDFSIDSHTGEVCVNRVLNREAIQQYKVLWYKIQIIVFTKLFYFIFEINIFILQYIYYLFIFKTIVLKK